MPQNHEKPPHFPGYRLESVEFDLADWQPTLTPLSELKKGNTEMLLDPEIIEVEVDGTKVTKIRAHKMIPLDGGEK